MSFPGLRQSALPLLVAGLCLWGSSGCVREVVEPIRETTYVTTRTGDQVTLTWVARRGVYYNVLYSERRDPGASWTLHSDGINLRATADGQQMSLTDRVPVGRERVYRLLQDSKPFRPRPSSAR